MTKIPYHFYLPEEKLPSSWLNLRAFMTNKPAPILNPQTLAPSTADELNAVFCEELVKQELDDTTPYIDIPGGVRDFYRCFRPAPIVRAYHLEKALNTPAHIYYKFEGNNTSGSHKLNSAAAQLYYAKQQGLKGVTTETGAGQWGTAVSMAAAFYGLTAQVYMVKVSAEQKPYRKAVMETYGAQVTASPSNTTAVGRAILEKYPDTQGSLGCAISEAVEAAVSTPDTRYVLGSVMNMVLLHQAIIGQESKTALDMLGVQPDIVVGCAGGGSNLGGLIAPYMAERLQGKPAPEFLAVEPASCPSLTRGRFVYDYADVGRITPLSKMYTLGSDFMPAGTHAGGLRFHGMSPTLSQLYHDGHLKAINVNQTKVFEAAKVFMRCEGILPAPESSHAIYGAINEAVKCRESGEQKTILFGLTGTGYFDMAAYMQFNSGTMNDSTPSEQELATGFAGLPDINA